MHMSTKPRLASLNVQHLPHVKKQVLAQRSYAHVYKTQTSLSLRATSSTREDLPKDHMTSTCELVKKQALAQRSYAHDYKIQTSLSLHATSSICEEASPCPKIICTCLQNPDYIASLYVQHLPHVKKQVLAQRSYTHFHM